MGKITVITGGTSGIGRGIAEKILAESAKEDRIFVTYGHDEKKAAVFRDSLPEEKKSQVILMKADMSSYDEMMAFVEELKKRADHIDWLVSNAGISTYAKYEDYSFEEWVRTLSKEQQLDLLAEYTIDAEREQGYNEWEKPIGDAQKAKDVTKKAIAVQAKEVIESYKKLMVEHEELITDIKEKIKNKRDEIDKIDGKINTKNAQITANNETLKAAKNAAPSQDQIDAAKEANKRLNE